MNNTERPQAPAPTPIGTREPMNDAPHTCMYTNVARCEACGPDTTCPNCGGAHPTQQCGEIRAALIDSRDDAHDLIAALRTKVEHQRRLLTGCRKLIRDAAIPVSVAFIVELERVIDSF